jgi:Fic family protein
MEQWLGLLQELDWSLQPGSRDEVLIAYVHLHVSFVRIHPFFDGNGRLARLVANLPVLRCGLPPIIIPRERRKQYIDLLSAYHHLVGPIRAGDELLPRPEDLEPFIRFCGQAWQETMQLVDEVHAQQRARNRDDK